MLEQRRQKGECAKQEEGGDHGRGEEFGGVEGWRAVMAAGRKAAAMVDELGADDRIETGTEHRIGDGGGGNAYEGGEDEGAGPDAAQGGGDVDDAEWKDGDEAQK